MMPNKTKEKTFLKDYEKVRKPLTSPTIVMKDQKKEREKKLCRKKTRTQDLDIGI